MKRILFIAAMMVIAVSLQGQVQSAAEEPLSSLQLIKDWEDNGTWRTSGIYTYRVLDESRREIELRKINSNEEKIVVPSQIDGYTVVCMGYFPAKYKEGPIIYDSYADYWSSECRENLDLGIAKNTLREIEIPETVKFIGPGAFDSFSQLETVKLPKKLEWIEEYAFCNCTMLDNLYLPSGVDLAGCAFCGCPSLKHIFSRDIAIPCLESSAFDGRVEEWHIYAKGDKYVLLNNEGIGSKIDTVYVAAGLKKMNIYFGWKYFIKRIYIHGKKTKLALLGGVKDIHMTLYTVADAASIKTARKHHISYKFKETQQVKNLKRKGGTYTWDRARTTVVSYRYRKGAGKWKVSRKSLRTMYLVYGRKTKQGKYRLVETTKKRKFSGAYRYVKVKAQQGWET